PSHDASGRFAAEASAAGAAVPRSTPEGGDRRVAFAPLPDAAHTRWAAVRGRHRVWVRAQPELRASKDEARVDDAAGAASIIAPSREGSSLAESPPGGSPDESSPDGWSPDGRSPVGWSPEESPVDGSPPDR